MTEPAEDDLAWFDSLSGEPEALPEDVFARLRMHEAKLGLRNGDLGPLATLLKAGDPIPRGLRLMLVLMIEGNALGSGGLRLKIDKHPDLARRSEAMFEQARKRQRELEIASFMVSAGAFRRGQHEAAVMQTAEMFGLKRSRILEIWRDHKGEMRQRANVRTRTGRV